MVRGNEIVRDDVGDVCEVDLEDVIIDSISIPISFLSMAFPRNVTIIGPDGEVEMSLIEEDEKMSFSDRIEQLNDIMVKYIVPVTGCGYARTAAALFEFDGWTWNRHIFRSPIWMNDYREMSIRDAMDIEGLHWLKDFMSENW